MEARNPQLKSDIEKKVADFRAAKMQSLLTDPKARLAFEIKCKESAEATKVPLRDQNLVRELAISWGYPGI